MDKKITYQKADLAFQSALNKRVQLYFDTNKLSKYGNSTLYIKIILLSCLYGAVFISMLFTTSIWALYAHYIIMGPLSIFLALNIGHDAAHNILFSHRKWNTIFTYTWDFLGANGEIWKYKHVESHHPLTNIQDIDQELEVPKFLRLFTNAKWIAIHKYQHLFMPIIYAFYILIWFSFRDYKDYYQLRKNSVKLSFTRLVVGKSLFILRMILLPYALLSFSFSSIFVGFILFTISASLATTFALISTHLGEHSYFPSPDKNGKMATSWIRHQIMTTSNFSTENKIITALYGGFNHHLTHHLYPSISHIHYPKITAIIKEECRKFDIQLIEELPVLKAMNSHFILLKKRGKLAQWIPWMEM